jgi:hypothetical protein
MKILLDANGYIEKFSWQDDGQPDGFIFTGELPSDLIDFMKYTTCYYISNNKILCDEIKKGDVLTNETLREERDGIIEELRKYDYIGTKIATGRATKEEYTDIIEQQIAWANRINEIDILLGGGN